MSRESNQVFYYGGAPLGIPKLSLLCLLIITVCQHDSEASPTTRSAAVTQAPFARQNSSTTSNSLTTTPANLMKNNHHLWLQYTDAGGIRIPGLYDDLAGHITPIQGQSQFDRLILGLGLDEDHEHDKLLASTGCLHSNLTDEQESIRRAAQRETISLVQFYMASCPDCQGFSPYFKRFSQDIAPHWQNLVQIYTVNCNDFRNIHLCQEQNPRLIVPMVRWYVFPSIQRDSIRRGQNNSRSKFHYPQELLNIAHRQFIPKQRRDLISLRQATLRFIALTLDELSNDSQRVKSRHSLQESNHNMRASTISPRRLFYESLPVAWHQLARLGRDQPDELEASEQFLNDLNERISRCSRMLFESECETSKQKNNTNIALAQMVTVRNFIVFEDRRSSIGRTIIADWSNMTCRLPSVPASPEQQNMTKQVVILHRSTDLSLLADTRIASQTNSLAKPILLTFNVSTLMSQNNDLANGSQALSVNRLDFKLLAWNETSSSSTISSAKLIESHNRTRRAAQRHRLERVQQRALLEEYYQRLNTGSKVIQPIRYAAAMSSIGSQNGRVLHKRDTPSEQTPEQRVKQQAELENVNWVPELVYPGEERIRHKFNEQLVRELAGSGLAPLTAPSSLLNGNNPDVILKEITNRTVAVEPVADDLTLMFLTDYYRALDEIVHIDMLSKGDVDGYQLLASCCFLRDLERHFPFQGNAHGSQEIGAKSIARHYIQLVQRAWLNELRARVRSKGLDQPSSIGNASTRLTLDSALQQLNERDGCVRLAESVMGLETGASLNSSVHGSHGSNKTIGLDKIHVPSRELEQIQLKIKRAHEVGLPPERHLKWKYCAGSAPYLRGHTCSLWILFHTLTVHEYLVATGDPLHRTHGHNQNNNSAANGSSDPIEYKFQIDYSKPPKRLCDPNNPDGAYLESKTSDLFVDQTRFVLANIINFVRYYLPCTNCAAHFSCMVEHSAGLNFDPNHRQQRSAPDSHLLWLWEGHNRVNERTRGTHSEDPTRPKHIFPSYGACPLCYMEQPSQGASFLSMRFNRAELVKFLVARYRKSAILNNQINIEDLYRKP